MKKTHKNDIIKQDHPERRKCRMIEYIWLSLQIKWGGKLEIEVKARGTSGQIDRTPLADYVQRAIYRHYMVNYLRKEKVA